MKKVLYILLVIIISTIILMGQCVIKDDSAENFNNTEKEIAMTENSNIIELKVTNVDVTEHGKFIDFKDNTGYYIGKGDENLWSPLEKIEVGNTIIIDTMGTESIEDDIVVGIK